MEIPVEVLLQRGAIFHSTIFPDIDHGKFFVVLQLEEDRVAYFYINSEIPDFLVNRPDQRELQLLLYQKNYTFLDYDSYLDAKEIQYYPKDEILNSLRNHITQYRDDLKPEDLDNMLEKCNNSRLYTKKQKDKYFYK